MAYSSGSSSLYAPCPISSLIVKGPYLFWSSFFEGWFVWIFLASSHTCSPVLRLACSLVILPFHYFFCSFHYCFCFCSLLFPSSLIGLSSLVSPFPLLGFLSRGVFHNSHRMESVLLLYIPCHYTRILLLLAILFNCFVCSWYNVLETL